MMKLKHVKLKSKPSPFNRKGVYSFVTTDWNYEDLYGKRNSKFPIGLKIFKDKYTSLKSFMWKLIPLIDATKIQNLYWFNGVAPRAYDIIEVEYEGETHIAQVTEILPESERGPQTHATVELIKGIKSKYGIGQISIDPNPNHQYKKYWIDFSQHKFVDDVYENYIRESMVNSAGWGSNPATYQSVSEMSISGQRSLEERMTAYKWDEVDFVGKTVLDYGCSSGQTSRECLRRGAKYVVGIDLPGPAKVAFELSNYLGYFNIDYYGDNFCHDKGNDVYQKIKDYTGKTKFDIVLYLSVMQLKKPPYLKEIVGEKFFLEGHTADKEETFRPWLEDNFSQVDYLGVSKDHSIRPVFRCKK